MSPWVSGGGRKFTLSPRHENFRRLYETNSDDKHKYCGFT